MEQWKPVSGYEGYYEVSSCGNVRSLPRDIMRSDGVIQHRRGKAKKLTMNPDGYLVVKLSMDGVDNRVPVHRLVADAFVPGYFDGAEINHIDFNRSNNDYSNLEWVSHYDNIKYTIDAGRHVCTRDLYGENNPNYHNRTLRNRYMEDQNFAKEKQSRPGAQNGRALPVALILNDGDTIEFGYCAECAQYLIDNGMIRANNAGPAAAHISRAAKTGTTYYGLHFNYI